MSAVVCHNFLVGVQGLAPCGYGTMGTLAGTCTLRRFDLNTALCDPHKFICNPVK
jgi:hypothetical protein